LIHRFHHLAAEAGLASGQPRLLIHAIPDHQENELSDNATIMLLEWRPSRSKALSSQAIA
jgi:hypothetical protein